MYAWIKWERVEGDWAYTETGANGTILQWNLNSLFFFILYFRETGTETPQGIESS